MPIEQNYFALLGLEESFQVDTRLLSERYRALQRQLHPDRFAAADERRQRLAVQQSAHLNDAVATLKSPLKRALYLLELKGYPVRDQDRRPMAAEFLLEQMELREALEGVGSSADPSDALEQLERQVAARRAGLESRFAELLQQGSDEALTQAVDRVRELQFLDKLQREIEQLEDRLTDL